MNFRSIIKYLTPKDVWLKRTALIFGYIFLDFLVTITFCRTPYMEANPYAKSFMLIYGIVPGLALYDFLLAIPIYAILVFDSHMIEYTQHYKKKTEFIIDAALGWLVAGAHFNGAMSWLWDAPHFIRQAVGFAIYMVIAILFFYSSPKHLSYLKVESLKKARRNI